MIDGPGTFPDLDPGEPVATPGGHRTVLLLGVPVSRFRSFDMHFDDLVRELQLIAVGNDQGLDTDARLRELARGLETGIANQRRDLTDQLLAAESAGLEEVDVTLRVGPYAAYAVRALALFVRQTDEHARAGRLLLPPTTTDHRHLLAWVVDQVTSQTEDGAPPVHFAAFPA
ncbi:MAG: hypothetical protein HYX34_07945 [Actinobacteria bacterium]|nr:hypothetical protein [Actinomycetota bacterium]